MFIEILNSFHICIPHRRFCLCYWSILYGAQKEPSSVLYSPTNLKRGPHAQIWLRHALLNKNKQNLFQEGFCEALSQRGTVRSNVFGHQTLFSPPPLSLPHPLPPPPPSSSF